MNRDGICEVCELLRSRLLDATFSRLQIEGRSRIVAYSFDHTGAEAIGPELERAGAKLEECRVTLARHTTECHQAKP
jgi:hypothetical protein